MTQIMLFTKLTLWKLGLVSVTAYMRIRFVSDKDHCVSLDRPMGECYVWNLWLVIRNT